MTVSVILPAAGLGTRMGSSGRKQFIHLADGAPVLLHTIRKFLPLGAVSSIIVAARADDLGLVEEMLGGETLGKQVRVVQGGDTRQESVENALRTVGPEVDLVAVHDAVRPFIDPETIQRVFDEAAEHGAAIVGIVPVDTVKQVHLHHIRTTIPREKLVLAQTPQVFRRELLMEAFERARADQFVGTDEASLVERLETVDVRVVLGSDRNIKITKPTDLKLAELFLTESRER
jgi:2-C-methyl-D-erythritol 4-phosphate cytidylyltransferase